MSLRRGFGAAVGLLLGAYFIWHCFRMLPQVDVTPLSTAQSWLGLAVATLLYMAGVPLAGTAWSQLTRGVYAARPRDLSLVIARSQAAKYIPGNVAQYAVRLALAVEQGMPLRVFLVSTAQETALVVAASASVGTLAMAIAVRGGPELPDSLRILALLLPAAVFAVLTLSALRSRIPFLERAWRLPLGHANLSLGDLLPSAWHGLLAFFFHAATYLLIGLGLWLLARSLGLPQSLGLPLITGAFALSWLLGFLAPGAPAGIGVRESAMVWLMAHGAPESEILVLVLMSRLATLSGDGLSFLAGWAATAREERLS